MSKNAVVSVSNKLPAVPDHPVSVAHADFYKSSGVSPVVMSGGPSLTRQEFAEECDINLLMKRYEQAGAGINWLPRDPNAEPFYGDFAELPTDLMSYMDYMKRAETAFMSLPANVRKEMDNDPVRFVEYATDPENLDKMREWGLAPPKPPEPEPPPAVPGGPAEPVLQAAVPPPAKPAGGS